MAVHRRSGIVPYSACVKVPVQQRIIACCAAPGTRGLHCLSELATPRRLFGRANGSIRDARPSVAPLMCPSAMNKSEAMTAIKVSKTVCKMAPNTRPIMPAIEPVTMMPTGRE